MRGMKRVKIFGERNTGTNALALFIDRNSSTELLPGTAREILPSYRGPLEESGLRVNEAIIDSIFEGEPLSKSWKHACTSFSIADLQDFQNCTTIILFRNPYSWCHRLWERPYNTLVAMPPVFAQFIGMNWPTVRRERMGEKALSPPELINEKMRQYLSFIASAAAEGIQVTVVPFELLVCDPLAVWRHIGPCLSEPSQNPTIVVESTKDRSKDLAYYQDYYGSELWKKRINDADMKLMQDLVDWNVYTELLKKADEWVQPISAKALDRLGDGVDGIKAGAG